MIVYYLGSYQGGCLLFTTPEQAIAKTRELNNPYAKSVVKCEVAKVMEEEIFMEIMTKGYYESFDYHVPWLRRVI